MDKEQVSFRAQNRLLAKLGPMQHAIVTSLLWSAGMLAVFAPLAAHLFARRTRG